MCVVPTVESITVGAVVFASTNIDDILLLSAFFAQPDRRVARIVIGQYLGIGALVLASVVAALAGLVIPRAWIALLGLVPLALGLRLVFAAPYDRATPLPQSEVGVMTVASVTVANGSDNLGVYIPLFAAQPTAIPLYVTVFAVGTAVWCAVAHALVSHPVVAARLTTYGHQVLPWVLMGVGVYVLWGAVPLVGL